MEPNSYDRLGWSSDKKIQEILGGEILYYTNKVLKYNKLSMKQERYLLLTNKCLYNLQNKKVKRTLNYKEILGITFSNQSNEFVIHALEGFDFHFICDEKLIIIYIIAKCYEIIVNDSIVICEVEEKSLKQFVTSKKLKKKDYKNTKLDKKFVIDTRTFLEDNPPPKINKTGSVDAETNNIYYDDNSKDKQKNMKKETEIFSANNSIKNISFDDFTIKDIIGRGNTCKVLLSLCSKNLKFYVIKSISKSNLEININEEENETLYSNLKNRLANLYYHFLNNIEFCFQTEEKLYFAFPFIEGESLYNLIKKEKNLDENKVKFYSSIIALSIKYLHFNHISNKNFSSKNIFIDKDGYLKIYPFHLGNILPLKKDYLEKILQKYKNEYTPPEIYLELNVNKKISDWWNLGILIYEMIFGITPFYSDSNTKLKNMICNQELKIPDKPHISETCKDLIKRLLNKKYNERLGFNNDFEEIKNHEFFKDINFDDLSNKKLESPFRPDITDMKNEEIKKYKIFTYEDLNKNGINIEKQ